MQRKVLLLRKMDNWEIIGEHINTKICMTSLASWENIQKYNGQTTVNLQNSFFRFSVLLHARSFSEFTVKNVNASENSKKRDMVLEH